MKVFYQVLSIGPTKILQIQLFGDKNLQIWCLKF